MYDLQYTFVFISSPVPEDFPFSLIPGIHKCHRGARGHDRARIRKPC